MKLANTTGGLFPYTQSQSEALKYLRQAGFRYADYSFIADYRGHTGIYGENPDRHIAQVAETAEQAGIRLVQAHSPMGSPIAKDNSAFLRDTIASVEACGKWGIPNIVVHLGYDYGLTKGETYQKNKEFFLPILETAEKYGVNILIENFDKMTSSNRYWTDNAPDLLEQIEMIAHPLCHAIWDVGHGNLQELPQHEAMGLLGGHIRALHIHDNMGDRDTHMMPGLGTVNWDSVICGLKAIGYTGYFTFEVGRAFLPKDLRRPYPEDTRLAETNLQMRIAVERYLYDLGKAMLESYECFEE